MASKKLLKPPPDLQPVLQSKARSQSCKSKSCSNKLQTLKCSLPLLPSRSKLEPNRLSCSGLPTRSRQKIQSASFPDKLPVKSLKVTKDIDRLKDVRAPSPIQSLKAAVAKESRWDSYSKQTVAKKTNVPLQLAAEKKTNAKVLLAAEKKTYAKVSLTAEKKAKAKVSLAAEKKTNAKVSLAAEKKINAKVVLAAEKKTSVKVSLAAERKINAKVSLAAEKKTNVKVSLAAKKKTNAKVALAAEKKTNVKVALIAEKKANAKVSLAAERKIITPIPLTAEKKTIAKVSLAAEKKTNAKVSLAAEKKTNTPIPITAEKKTNTPVPLAAERKINTPIPLTAEKKTNAKVSLPAEKKTNVKVALTAEKKTNVKVALTAVKKTNTPVPLAAEKKNNTPVPLAAEKKTNTPGPLVAEKKSNTQVQLAAEKKTNILVPLAAEKKTNTPVPLAAEKKAEKKTNTPVPLAAEMKTNTPVPLAAEKKVEPSHEVIVNKPAVNNWNYYSTQRAEKRPKSAVCVIAEEPRSVNIPTINKDYRDDSCLTSPQLIPQPQSNTCVAYYVGTRRLVAASPELKEILKTPRTPGNIFLPLSRSSSSVGLTPDQVPLPENRPLSSNTTLSVSNISTPTEQTSRKGLPLILTPSQIPLPESRSSTPTILTPSQIPLPESRSGSVWVLDSSSSPLPLVRASSECAMYYNQFVRLSRTFQKPSRWPDTRVKPSKIPVPSKMLSMQQTNSVSESKKTCMTMTSNISSRIPRPPAKPKPKHMHPNRTMMSSKKRRAILNDMLLGNDASFDDTLVLMKEVKGDKHINHMLKELQTLNILEAEYTEKEKIAKHEELTLMRNIQEYGLKLKTTIENKKKVEDDLKKINLEDLDKGNEYGMIEKYLSFSNKVKHLDNREKFENATLEYLQKQLNATKVNPNKRQIKRPKIEPRMTKNALRLQKEKGREVRAFKLEKFQNKFNVNINRGVKKTKEAPEKVKIKHKPKADTKISKRKRKEVKMAVSTENIFLIKN